MKITAYKTGEHHMPIKPASRDRLWMDQTIHKYAYRCLPLQIANSNGWIMECPDDIIIHWDGSDHKNGLSVHYANSPWDFAASSFGYGIVTFHPGLLFRTPSEPKYDLWVGGIPNQGFAFMEPLTGVVETWWNPATFTMNWKLYQPGTFKVEKGSPIVFITPIPHDVPEWETELLSIHENKEVLQDFDNWAKGRERMIHALDVLDKTGIGTNGIDPKNPATQWQKDYFQGKNIQEHHTKRKFSPFE